MRCLPGRRQRRPAAVSGPPGRVVPPVVRGIRIEVLEGLDASEAVTQLAHSIRPPGRAGRRSTSVGTCGQNAHFPKHEWFAVRDECLIPVKVALAATGGGQLLESQPSVFRVSIDPDPVDVISARVVGNGILGLAPTDAYRVPQPLDVRYAMRPENIYKVPPCGNEYSWLVSVVDIVPLAPGEIEFPEGPDQDAPVRGKLRSHCIGEAGDLAVILAGGDVRNNSVRIIASGPRQNDERNVVGSQRPMGAGKIGRYSRT